MNLLKSLIEILYNTNILPRLLICDPLTLYTSGKVIIIHAIRYPNIMSLTREWPLIYQYIILIGKTLCYARRHYTYTKHMSLETIPIAVQPLKGPEIEAKINIEYVY
jgi:hypothetical protein